ncbi:hypothetical protein Patl1_14222 [Pistacia atlantica]|uniref:Uncharacterized protein n=1 Tax=Pistacia atlantica TaxID=434234 RepID=A0ACC1AUR0_9ROSI|nr:hypothetical protein Patl1_14222 [Pistacia atlantica]
MFRQCLGACHQRPPRSFLRACKYEKQSPDSNNGSDQWADLFVNEMVKASSLDDARLCARDFESLVNAKQKELTDKLMKENRILKRAVFIQHEQHLKEGEELKKMMSSYQEQLKDLEVKTYALMTFILQINEDTNTQWWGQGYPHSSPWMNHPKVMEVHPVTLTQLAKTAVQTS